MISTPCMLDGMSDAEYHADPVEGGSISSTGIKTILRSPAHFKWQRENRVEKSAFDLGHAVHSLVLGIGLDIITIPSSLLASNGATSTKEAKAFIADAREAGKVPLKEEIVVECNAMTQSVLAHPIARKLLEQEGGAEQSFFAQDPETGVWIRARIDYLPRLSSTAIDLKTSVSADPRDFMRSAAEYGYDIQSEFYQHALRLVRGDKDTSFQFIVVEKSAPYLVSVIELDAEFAAIGRVRMRRGINLFKECSAVNEWQGYEAITHLVSPPTWLAYEEEMVI